MGGTAQKIAYFDVAADAARREAARITRVIDRVRRETLDPTDVAQHNAHDAVLTMGRAILETLSSDRCKQLEERADELIHLFCQIKEQARDKGQALKECGR